MKSFVKSATSKNHHNAFWLTGVNTVACTNIFTKVNNLVFVFASNKYVRITESVDKLRFIL